jgi:hypothetical protein
MTTMEDAERAAGRTFAGREWKGGKITEAGCYRMPIEAYHADCCAGPSISSSGLRLIEAKSPAHYWCDSYLNPDRADDAEESEAFRLGRAAHHLLLGETEFNLRFAIRPARFDSWRTNEAKAWRAGQIADGKTVLIDGEVTTVRGMASSLARHALIRNGLLNGEVERSLIWQDKETGVWLKARPDVIPLDTDIVDLKTIADAGRRGLEKSLTETAYHMQLALVGMGMEAIFNRPAESFHYTLVFVEKKAPWASVIAPVDMAAIWWGRKQLRRAIRKFAECVEKNDWPGYDHDLQTLALPDWYVKRLEAQIAAGQLSEAE